MMSILTSSVLEYGNRTTEKELTPIKFCSYKLKPSLSVLPLSMVKHYTSEDIRTICEILNNEFVNKYCLKVIGGKAINKYLFVRIGNPRSQGSTKYVQLDLDTFETVNVWEANEFTETIEIGEYNA